MIIKRTSLILLFCGALVLGMAPCRAQERLSSLPPAGTEISGWIGQQIHEDASNGWVSVCDRMSHEGILAWDANTLEPVPYYLPWDKGGAKGREAWNRSVPYYQTLIEPMGSYGEGEFEAHWLDMLFRMGWIGNIPKYQDLSRQAVKDILDSRDKTGYIGVDAPWIRFTESYTTPFGLKNGDFEIFGISELLNALLTYQRFTGDARTLEAVTKAADLTLEHTRGREFTTVDGFSALGWVELYRATGRKEYLDMARTLTDRLLRMEYLPQLLSCDKSETHGHSASMGTLLLEMLAPNEIARDPKMLELGCDKSEIHGHSATTGILLLQMLGLNEATGDPQMLELARRISERVEWYAMQSHGAPTGHAEALAASGPRVNTEGCDITWFGWAWIELLKATGEAHYADLVEKAALNALPGHRSKDGAVAPYFSRPNQLFATRGSGMGTVYATRVFVDCCHGNLGRLLPVLAENLVLSTKGGDFVIPFYDSSHFRGHSSKAGNVEIFQETDYPFSENIKITVKPEQHPANFTLRLRVPSWCRQAQVSINGKRITAEAKNSWIDLNRAWGESDSIQLTLPMETRVEIDKQGLAVVQHGPLVYSLPVEGRRVEVDKWGSFEQLVTADSKWNYALVLDKANPAASFHFVEQKVPQNANLWEYPRTALEVEAVRVPEWKFDKDPAQLIPSETEVIPEPPFPARPLRATGPKETIRLVPYGCTILRMTSLPVVDSSN